MIATLATNEKFLNKNTGEPFMITRHETGFSQPRDDYRHHQTSIKLHLGSLFGKKGIGSNFKVYSRFELPGEISPEIEIKNQILVNEFSF
jgi:hypothetical protein